VGTNQAWKSIKRGNQWQGLLHLSATWRPAATAGGGKLHVSVPPLPWRQGPQPAVSVNGRRTAPAAGQRDATRYGGRACRHSRRRHPPRVAWLACRHGTFAICTEEWSFLPFHWGRWSFLTKIRNYGHTTSSLLGDRQTYSYIIIMHMHAWESLAPIQASSSPSVLLIVVETGRRGLYMPSQFPPIQIRIISLHFTIGQYYS
jgi:hypothetical protein